MQQAEGAVRDVLPQPVDGKFTSATDQTDETITQPESWDRRQGEGVALLCPDRRPTTSHLNSATKNHHPNRTIEINCAEPDETTQSLSLVPAVAGGSDKNRVVVSAMAGTVGQGFPQVSTTNLKSQTDTAASIGI